METDKKQPGEKPVLIEGPEAMVEGLFNLQKDNQVVLYLPSDYYDLFQTPLENRMKNIGLHLAIAKQGNPPENLGSIDHTLSYQCSKPVVPPNKEVDQKDLKQTPANKTDVFEIKGAPTKKSMTPFPREAFFWTDLDKRYFFLREIVSNQEENKHFLELANIQQNIRIELLNIEENQKEVDVLTKQIETVDKEYYQILQYILKEAIDNVLQIVTLGEIMKRYVKVLIIDDLGEHSLDRLEDKGFRKRLLSTMSHQTFKQVYLQFEQKFKEQHPDKNVTYSAFFMNCSVFNEYQIVFYNPWKTDKGEMPVQLCLRKSADLLKKEIRKKNEDPAKVMLKVNKLKDEYQNFETQLDTTNEKLRSAEAENNLAESAYVALNKKRKRIIKKLEKINIELNMIQKAVDDKPKYTFYQRDFISVIKNRKTAKQIMPQGNLVLANLQNMSDLVIQKKKKNRQIKQLKDKIKMMMMEIQEKVKHNPLDPEKSFQQILGTHILNKIEMTVLGCGIAKVNNLLHLYPGPYFSKNQGKSLIDWNDDLVASTSIYIASKHFSVDTSLLQKFFRVNPGDVAERIENSPSLPNAGDFNNDDYDLFIINFGSYTFQTIIDTLKMRNQSERSFVPVLILDSMNQISNDKKKVILNLLIGLKKESPKTLSLITPVYRIDSLNDPSTLCPVLCETMGINEKTIPSFVEEEPDSEIEDVNLFDQLSDTQDSEPDKKAPLASDDDEKESPTLSGSSNQENNEIQVSLIAEQPEEIYTLGSLFSFDDDSQISTPIGSGEEAVSPSGDADTEENDQIETLKEQPPADDIEEPVDNKDQIEALKEQPPANDIEEPADNKDQSKQETQNTSEKVDEIYDNTHLF